MRLLVDTTPITRHDQTSLHQRKLHMKRYSLYHVPILSFFSARLYRDVAIQWKGVGFLYLLLLLAICWIPVMVDLHTSLSDFVDNEAPKIVTQVPTLTIVDGEASIEEPQPYYITDPDTGDPLVIIDTTDQITSLHDTDAIALITKTQAEFRKSKFETRTFRFDEIKNFTVDQATINRWLDKIKTITAPALYPLAVAGSFVYRIVQMLIYALVGMLFASCCGSTRSYASLLRLATVAVTPCILVSTILGLANVHVPIAGLWYLLGALAYLFFGVRAASRVVNEQATDDPWSA